MSTSRNGPVSRCLEGKVSFVATALLLGLGLLIFGMSAGCGRGPGDRVVLRVAHPLDRNHPVHLAAERMGQVLEEESGGKMQLKIYPNGQLGGLRETIELLQIGSLDMTVASAAVLESFIGDLRVFGFPYIFRDDDHRIAVLSGEVGRGLFEAGLDQRLRGLAYFDAGSRSFYTRNRPIRHPDDLAGLRVRVIPSPMARAMVRALGGSPASVNWGELYSALQQGVVDAAENNPPSYFLSRHYEITGYFSLNEHTAIPDMLIISEPVWQRLGPREREWLEKAVAVAERYQWEVWADAVREAFAELEAAGVEIITPDRRPFMDRVESIYERTRETDPGLYKIVERVRRMEP